MPILLILYQRAVKKDENTLPNPLRKRVPHFVQSFHKGNNCTSSNAYFAPTTSNGRLQNALLGSDFFFSGSSTAASFLQICSILMVLYLEFVQQQFNKWLSNRIGNALAGLAYGKRCRSFCHLFESSLMDCLKALPKCPISAASSPLHFLVHVVRERWKSIGRKRV